MPIYRKFIHIQKIMCYHIKWNKMFRKKGLWWMKAESTLAKMISTAGEKAAYDTACKRLLAK